MTSGLFVGILVGPSPALPRPWPKVNDAPAAWFALCRVRSLRAKLQHSIVFSLLRFRRAAATRPRAVAALPAALAILLLAATAGNPSAQAADKNLPVPRFVSLRSDQVNVRTGPGERYPIDWIFTRKDMPVEIVAEFENWRKVRDWQGTEGWVHQRMVTGRRSVIVAGAVRELHRRPRGDAEIVARAEPGVIARLLECQGGWCRVEKDGVTGWLARDQVWGVYPNETVQ
jgi:SH3-like domain-containing protein